MKVGYYISNIMTSDGGIYQYTIYILKMLLKCPEIEQVVVFKSKSQNDDFKHMFSHPKVKTITCKERGRVLTFAKKLSDYFLSRYYMKKKSNKTPLFLYKILNPDRWFLNKFNLDVLHVPRQHSPAYILRYPVVISMHDVQQFYFPEFFSPLERIYKSISYYTSLCETDHVIVSYNHVKKDLIKYFPIESDKINVCPVPVNEDWVSDNLGTSFDELKQKYNIPDEFILTPAATWEHKNHNAVIEALLILRKEGRKVFWVATGNKTKYYEKIKEKIAEFNLSDQVLFTGIVPDLDLKGLYKSTRLVVIPTLYEAGSGPLFEAMRYQTPVICSNVTSLPDTIGDNQFVFNPYDYEQIALLIKKSLTDVNFINENKQNSEKSISKISNQNFSLEFIHAYRSAISTKRNFIT